MHPQPQTISPLRSIGLKYPLTCLCQFSQDDGMPEPLGTDAVLQAKPSSHLGLESVRQKRRECLETESLGRKPALPSWTTWPQLHFLCRELC